MLEPEYQPIFLEPENEFIKLEHSNTKNPELIIKQYDNLIDKYNNLIDVNRKILIDLNEKNKEILFLNHMFVEQKKHYDEEVEKMDSMVRHNICMDESFNECMDTDDESFINSDSDSEVRNIVIY